MTELAILLAKTGLIVIVDAKYDRYHLRQTLIQTANAQRIPLKIVFCEAEIEELRSRLQRRMQQNSDVADATPALLEKQLAEFEALTASERELILTASEMQAILS
jgi:predicted kinase